MIFLASNIDWKTVGIVLGVVAILAIVFGVLIVIVSKLCQVKVDEKESKVKDLLSGANCGGCGYAGCADFAKAICEGKADISNCNATSKENKAEIAKILGVEFTAGVECFAVVRCAGGDLSQNKYDYIGNESCASQNAYMGGKKVCPSACLGCGDCKNACEYSSILVKNGVAVVDKRICGACGACVKKCPKHIIDLIPKTAKVYVACSSKCKGKEVMDACKVGCIGCGLCAKNCPQEAITMVDNLPVIDYTKCTGCKVCVAKCPRNTIKEI